MASPRVALLPAGTRVWLADAVRDAGGTIVGPDEAEALVWTDPGRADELAALLRSHEGVRWVQLPWAGIESFVGVLDPDRVWTCGKGVYAEPVAEHALALLLAGIREVASYARKSTWTPPRGRNLLGARVVILGGGEIAQSLLRLLGPFGAHVTVVRRHPARMNGAEVVGAGELHEALHDANALVLALALTPSTIGIVGRAELDLLAPGAWVVNVARGRHVVTDELVSALRAGRLGGAALDVTDPEPLPDGHPLWSLPNCVITPHVGNTPDMAAPLLSARIRENVKRYAAGAPLVGLVDPSLGY
jgi:phosphoglycerate dehydrogenase-like enzyme